MKSLWIRLLVASATLLAVLGPFVIYAPIGVNAVCTRHDRFGVALCGLSTLSLGIVMLFVTYNLWLWLFRGRK